MSHKQSRRKDEFVVGAKRIAIGRNLVEKDARNQAASAEMLPCGRGLLLPHNLSSHIRSPDLHHHLRDL